MRVFQALLARDVKYAQMRQTPLPFVVYTRKAVILRGQIWSEHESDVVGLHSLPHLGSLVKFRYPSSNPSKILRRTAILPHSL